MKMFRFIALVAVAALMTGCCFCKRYERKYGKPLQGTPWTLVQMDGQAVDRHYLLVLDANKGLTISGFEELSATYDHNRDGKIDFTFVRPATSALTAKLEATDGYKMNGPFLMLTSAGEMWALFEAKAPEKPAAGPMPLP